MARYTMKVAFLAAGVILALGVVRPHPALALSTETFQLNPNGGSNFLDPDQKVYQQYRNNEDALSGSSGDNTGGNSRGLTFGSPDSGFSMSIGRTDNPYGNGGFGSQRFFGPDPFMPPR
jgi:hypothetical protein